MQTRRGEYVIRTWDEVMGRTLFTRRRRGEMNILTRAIDAATRLGLDPLARSFIDVGANIGTTTIPALLAGFPTAIAVEPEPDNARILRANLALNGLDQRATVVQAAASNEPGEMLLKRSDTNSGAHTLSRSGRAEGIRVEVQTIDRVTMGEPVGMVWLDVQGHEGHALAGAHETLRTLPPVVFELGPKSHADDLDLLREALTGYTHLIALRGKTGPTPPTPIKQALSGHPARISDFLAVSTGG